MVCAKGCCCGRIDRDFNAVPIDFYKQEYKNRKIRKQVQLTMSGCLGPCPLANVVLLFFDGRPVWFQSIDGEAQIRAVFDYIQSMLAADGYLPPPAELADYVFTYYAWTHPAGTRSQESGVRSQETVASSLTPDPCPLTPGQGILLLTHADTDLLTLQRRPGPVPDGLPPVRALSLGKVATEEHLTAALTCPGQTDRVIVVRLLGGLQSVPGFRALAESVRSRGQHLLVVSGAGSPIPN